MTEYELVQKNLLFPVPLIESVELFAEKYHNNSTGDFLKVAANTRQKIGSRQRIHGILGKSKQVDIGNLPLRGGVLSRYESEKERNYPVSLSTEDFNVIDGIVRDTEMSFQQYVTGSARLLVTIYELAETQQLSIAKKIPANIGGKRITLYSHYT